MMYEVLWKIEVEAVGVEEAARTAREFQLDHDSSATVFKVRKMGSGEPYTQIDLLD